MQGLSIWAVSCFFLFANEVRNKPSFANRAVCKEFSGHRSHLVVVSKQNGFDLEKNMPWIAAFSIGVMTVIANIYVSALNRRTSLDAIDRQIANAQSISYDQIDLARKASERDFNKTVVFGARQAWLNSLRDHISNVISIVKKMSFRQSFSNEEANDLWLNIAKIELMLTPTEYLDLLETFCSLEKCCKEIQIGNEGYENLDEVLATIKTKSSIVLKEEWQKHFL
mgnify:CR=1 FL=1